MGWWWWEKQEEEREPELEEEVCQEIWAKGSVGQGKAKEELRGGSRWGHVAVYLSTKKEKAKAKAASPLEKRGEMAV